MKEQFFNKLIQTYLKMQKDPIGQQILVSSAFENYPDWFTSYSYMIDNLPEELADDEIYAHWKIWVERFLNSLKENENLITFSPNGIILYRALLLHGKEKIRFESLGECWSVHPHTKVIFEDEAEEGAEHHLTLKSEVPLSAIDFEAVVEFFTNLYAFNEEGEVRLFKGQEIKVVAINEEVVDLMGVV